MPWPEITTASSLHKLDARLIAAIVQTESAGRIYVTRYEPAYRYTHNEAVFASGCGTTTETERIHQMTSWGLMQIMGGVLREHGFKNNMPQALDPETNLNYGCKHFIRMLKQNKNNIVDAIASYNAGSARKTDDGKYVNQAYVDKVWTYCDELGYGLNLRSIHSS